MGALTIVERFNRMLAECLFGHQYAVEMLFPLGQRSTAWFKRLPNVAAALNGKVTCLTGKKPAVAIKAKVVSAKPSTPYSRPVGVNEKKLPYNVNIRYLYQPGELEGGTKRATDPIWSLKVYMLERFVTRSDKPVLYYLHEGPKRGFVHKELLVVCKTHSFFLLMPCEIQLAPCGSHLAAPSVCHNTCSAPASAAHKWPSASHTESSIFNSISGATQGHLDTLPGLEILPLRHALCAELLFFCCLVRR